MKALWQVIALLCVLHVAVALVGLGALTMTGRLNRERLDQVADIFRMTIAEEEADQQRVAELEAQAAAQSAEEARRDEPAVAVQSVAQELDADRQSRDLALRQIERYQEDLAVLRRNLELSRRAIERRHAELQEQKRAFEAQIAQWQQQRDSEGFDKTVQLYEQLPPRQAKQMFLDVFEQPEGPDQLVLYLEAMQPRKAAEILAEFKEPREIACAVELMEQLRARGNDLVQAVEDVR